MTSSPARAVVAGHADFADGVVSAVAQISGQGERFATLSNRGLGAEEILAALRALLDATGARVVFTDLPAGSCTMAARRLIRERPDVILVTGTSVAALLDFVFAGDATPEQAARHAAEHGRGALLVTGGAPSPSTAGD